jgi:hypothetical protein
MAVTAAMLWLLLTRPVEVASAVSDRDVAALLQSVASQLSAWFSVLLRWL